MDSSIIQLAERTELTPATLLSLLPTLHHVNVERSLVHLFNLPAGFKHSLFAIHEKKRLGAKVDNVAMATNPSVSCIPGDASSIKEVAQ
jgi:hypothetical protein